MYLHLPTLICGCRLWAQEGIALLEKAAGQGHAYAMFKLGETHGDRKEHEKAFLWTTKGAETGLPKAMFNLGVCLYQGVGVAPDYPAAAGWYRCAADAGFGVAAGNLSTMYTVGRGTVYHTMPATSSSMSSTRPSFLELNCIL